MKKSTENTAATATREPVEIDIKVTRANSYTDTKTFFDAEIGPVKLYGLTFIEGTKNGDFIAMPSRKGSDGKYYDYFWFPQDKEFTAGVKKQIEALL